MNNHNILYKITVALLFVLLITLGMWIYVERYSAENMARNSNRCLNFFELSNTHYHFIFEDEMHSQGKDCFAFGDISYYLNGLDLKSFERLKKELRYNGANFTDSVATFRLQRDNIDGTFRLFLYDAPYQVGKTGADWDSAPEEAGTLLMVQS